MNLCSLMGLKGIYKIMLMAIIRTKTNIKRPDNEIAINGTAHFGPVHITYIGAATPLLILCSGSYAPTVLKYYGTIIY